MYGADFHNLHFLTGDVSTVDSVCEDYRIIHELQEDGFIRLDNGGYLSRGQYTAAREVVAQVDEEGGGE